MISKKRFILKRIIDDTFGKALFTVFSLRSKRSIPKKVNKVVIFKLSTLGDSLLSLPAIKKLKEDTGAKIVLVHSGDNKVIFENQGFIDEKIFLDVSRNNLFGFLKALFKIKKVNADFAVDLSHTGYLSAIFSMVSGKFLIGFFNPDVPLRKGFFDFEFPIGGNHMVANYFGIFSKINKKEILGEFTLISPSVDKRARQKIEKVLRGKKNLVGVHPCHEINEKSWSKENFAEIINYIILKGKVPVILGSPKEKPKVQKLLQLVKNRSKILDLSGKLNVSEVFGLMKHLEFFVSNDGGIMHISGSFGIPTLGIFSAENPKKYAPYNKKSYAIDARRVSKEESLKTAKKVIDIFLKQIKK
ncbi:MAG: glycosyltransferase family 9 protein [archaeon]|nr:glycosyltransferase family 9 protein [archaeon]